MKSEKANDWYEHWQRLQAEGELSDEDRRMIQTKLRSETSAQDIQEYNELFRPFESTNPWESSDDRIRFKKAALDLVSRQSRIENIEFKKHIISKEVNWIIRRNLGNGPSKVGVPSLLYLTALEIMCVVRSRSSNS